MDLYQVYNLPPPLPASPFSLDHSPSRARFPPFLEQYPSDPAAQADALRQWLNKLLFWDMDHAFFVQVKVCAGILCMLVALALFIVAKRIKERNFWLIRFGGTGLMIIPNAVNAFTTMEGMYGIIAVALAFQLSNFYEHGHTPNHIILWMLLPWIPLIWGAAYSCWGALLAAPDRGGNPGRLSLRSIVKRPLFANSVCLGIPLAESISVVIPAIIGDVKYQRSLHKYLAWRDRYASANQLSRDMLVEATEVYDGQLDAIQYVEIGFIMWTVWGSLFVIVYNKIVFGLFIDILNHTRMLRSRDTTSRSIKSDNSCKNKVQQKLGKLATSFDTEKGLTSAGIISGKDSMASPRALAAPEDFPHGGGAAERGEQHLRVKTAAARGRAEQPEMAMATETLHVFSRQEVAEDLPNTSFFPPVKPSKVLPQATATGSSNRASHAKLFQFLCVNFAFQFVGICIAILVYIATAILVVVKVYAAYEANDVRSVTEPAFLLAFWAAAVFGCVTLFAIALRTYERAVPVGAVSEPTGETPRVNQGAFASLASPKLGQADSGQRKQPRFTRATKKATQIAADHTYAGSDHGSFDAPVEDFPFDRSNRGSISLTPMPVAARKTKAYSSKSSGSSDDVPERLEQLADPRSNDGAADVELQTIHSPTAASKPANNHGHKLLTPEDFQRKERSRPLASSGSPPPEETPLFAALNTPVAPGIRRHAHQNSVKLSSGQSSAQLHNKQQQQRQQAQGPWMDQPWTTPSASTSVRPSLDFGPNDAVGNSDSDLE